MKKHKRKLKLARRIMTKLDIQNHISPFQIYAWFKRKSKKISRFIIKMYRYEKLAQKT